MFERFTGEARKVVVHAQEEARELHHQHIGTEHLLLGLTHDQECLAAKALQQLGVTHAQVREQVIELVGKPDAPPFRRHLPFTKRAKKALELSLREALHLRHNDIGTEHILLGLVRQSECTGARVLRGLKATPGQVRQTLRELISDERADLPAAAEQPATPARHSHTPAAADVLATAEELAGGSPVGSHHLLEALARGHRSAAARALAAAGVDVEVLTAKLDEIGLEDTSDLTPEEKVARLMELRLTDEGEVQLVLRDEETVAQVRALTEQLGGPLRGADPLASGMVGVYQAVRRYLARLERRLAPPAAELEQTAPLPLTPGTSTTVQQAVWSRLRRRRAQ